MLLCYMDRNEKSIKFLTNLHDDLIYDYNSYTHGVDLGN